jgi:class 3 adenylate cyclase/CheY-like chemotaxis protein
VTSDLTNKGNILVVDDTPDNVRLLTTMLKDHGYKARYARSGPLALTAVGSFPPDLILLDITMPEMNGYEVCQKLKSDEQTCAIPVIFISALDEVVDKVKAFDVGGVDYITKPFEVREVLARVDTHLTLHRLRQQLHEANRTLEQRVADRTAELARLNAAYACFVPHEFLNLLQKNSITEVHLGDQMQQEMTVVFADIRAFTTLSEQMTPQENFTFINDYLSRVSPVIRQHYGFIDKYIGDAIMALFPHEADDALQAAIALLKEVACYNEQRQAQGTAPIQVGIGLHTGSLMLGIIGESQRMQGTVIADAVNVAARLEGLTKFYGASIIISEQTRTRLASLENYTTRFIGKVQVKGKQEPVAAFEVLDGEPEASAALKQATRETFEAGLHLYYQQAFAEASVKFTTVRKHNPDDKAALLYLERAAHSMVHGVPSNWGGVETMTEK